MHTGVAAVRSDRLSRRHLDLLPRVVADQRDVSVRGGLL
jgi:hypothetical protein